MAEAEQHFHEEEQYEGDGMEHEGAGDDGHEENADVSLSEALFVTYAFYSLM